MQQSLEIAVVIRPAQRSDLDAINRLIDCAALQWAREAHQRPGRLPDCRFEPMDLDLDMLLVVIGARQHVLGVISCACGRGADSQNVLHLDGPYVAPSHRHTDIGEQLLAEAKALARRQGRAGLVLERRLSGQSPAPTARFSAHP